VHRWYSYTQGFSPGLVAQKIKDHRIAKNKNLLDPFCGSGTTLVTAKFFGINNLALEANPLMAMITQAKTEWDVNIKQFEKTAYIFLHQVEEAIEDYANQPELKISIPMKSINKWFYPEVLREVIIAKNILDSQSRDNSIWRKIKLAFSKSLFEASQVSMCPGITFTKKRKQPLLFYLKDKIDQIISDLTVIKKYSSDLFGKTKVLVGDSRSADEYFPHSSVDFIFTSPPYPTDIEYTRQTRAELFFLGFINSMEDVKSMKKTMIRGSPKNIYKEDNNEKYVENFPLVQHVAAEIKNKLAGKDWGWDYSKAVKEYFGDMYLSLHSFFHLLRPESWCLLVVGDQTCKGIKIPVSEILLQIGESLGYEDSYIELVRKRRSTTHEMALEETIVGLKRR
jgi:hypothetical protein